MVHLGIIPDGNRRWCKENNIDYKMNSLTEVWFKIFIKQLCELSEQKMTFLEKINSLSFYVCSIENIRRQDNTSKYIYELLEKLINFYFHYEEILEEIIENEEKKRKVQLYCKHIFTELNIYTIGELHELPDKIQLGFQDIMNNNNNEKQYKLYLAIAYDFKKDILNYGINNNKNYTRNQEEIDILLRTGGELRLSGFFPTHINYAEFFFLDKYWPSITLQDIDDVIDDFLNVRQRRFGK
tara:strand:+ start:5360 stop:6079 length:720 start_codon:yes stop_codon:yes gene_type:complete